MPTIAQIAAKALGAVQKAIPDAVHAASLSEDAQGAYSTTTGAYAITTTTAVGRAVVASETPVNDIFPSFVVGPTDRLIYLEGFARVKENDVLSFAGITLTIKAVSDIAQAGTFFAVIASG